MRWPIGSIRHTVPLLSLCAAMLVPALLFAVSSTVVIAQTPPSPKPVAADSGARAYSNYCASCHQENGQGIAGAFPPLVGHVPGLLGRAGGREYLIRVVLFGLAGEISVNGQNFSGVMPPWESIRDNDIATALNHAATAWDNTLRLPADFKPFQASEIAAARGEKLASTAVHALRQKLVPASSASVSTAVASAVTFTEAQATEGLATYAKNCADCHGSTLDNGEFGGAPLRGLWFRNKWGNGSVASLYAFTKAKMPPDRPGALSDKVYADLVAYILSVNGYKPGNQELPADPKAQQPLSLKRD